jgi:hypothetical protein
MINSNEARALAIKAIESFQNESRIAFSLLEHDTITFEDGWIFYWDSTAYIESGKFEDAIAGNAPLVIFKNGDIRQAPTSLSEPSAILKWIEENPNLGWFNCGQGGRTTIKH